jgi:antitoxin VapB
MGEERRVHLFRNGRNQALRIPKEFELDADKAILRKEGDRLIIEPVPRAGLLELLASWGPEEERLPEVEDRPAEPVDI